MSLRRAAAAAFCALLAGCVKGDPGKGASTHAENIQALGKSGSQKVDASGFEGGGTAWDHLLTARATVLSALEAVSAIPAGEPVCLPCVKAGSTVACEAVAALNPARRAAAGAFMRSTVAAALELLRRDPLGLFVLTEKGFNVGGVYSSARTEAGPDGPIEIAAADWIAMSADERSATLYHEIGHKVPRDSSGAFILDDTHVPGFPGPLPGKAFLTAAGMCAAGIAAERGATVLTASPSEAAFPAAPPGTMHSVEIAISASRIAVITRITIPAPFARGGTCNEGTDLISPCTLTVTLPADQPAGAYTGEGSVEVDGLAPLRIPISSTIALTAIPVAGTLCGMRIRVIGGGVSESAACGGLLPPDACPPGFEPKTTSESFYNPPVRLYVDSCVARAPALGVGTATAEGPDGTLCGLRLPGASPNLITCAGAAPASGLCRAPGHTYGRVNVPVASGPQNYSTCAATGTTPLTPELPAGTLCGLAVRFGHVEANSIVRCRGLDPRSGCPQGYAPLTVAALAGSGYGAIAFNTCRRQ